MKFKEIPPRQRGLITRGIRNSFVQSDVYKEIMECGRIEKPRYKKDGSLSKIPNVFYTCEYCNNLHKSSNIHVDHIEPVIGVDETLADLTLDEYAERVHYSPCQRLCKSCHLKKSKAENKERRLNKKKRKK